MRRLVWSPRLEPNTPNSLGDMVPVKEQAALDDAIRTLEVIDDIREEAAALSSSR